SQVKCVGSVSDSTNRNNIHSGGGNICDTIQINAAGSFGCAPTIDNFNAAAQLLHREVIQENPGDSGSHHGFNLCWLINFHDDRGGMPNLGLNPLDCVGQCAVCGSSQCGQMIVFEHDSIGQTEAVIDAATRGDGVFFQRS